MAVPSPENMLSGSFIFYATLFVSFILLLVGVHYLYSKLREENEEAHSLLERRRHVEKELKLLQRKLAGHEIGEQEYLRLAPKKQKELSAVTNQILDFEATAARLSRQVHDDA